MIFGPINTNGAVNAEIDFTMKLDIEPRYDFLRLYVSNDGSGWTKVGEWSSANGSWASYSIDLSSYVNPSNPTLYLKWGFSSDYSVQYSGVWVDDVNLWLLPGTVTISGTVTYTDRYTVARQPASYLNIQVWEQDKNGSWNLLEEKAADSNGHYQFDPRENWDDDPGDADHRLDLYLLYESVYNKGKSNEHIVTNLNNQVYRWDINGGYVRWNIPNGAFNTTDALPPDPDSGAKAAWLFEDILHAFTTFPGDPGPARIRWQKGTTCTTIFGQPACSALFVPDVAPNGVFIPDLPQSVDSQDVVVHETAHQYMSNSNGFWYPLPGGWDTDQTCVAHQHRFFDITTDVCAYTEGWADFVAIAVNQSFLSTDKCFDWSPGHCSSGSQDIEAPHRSDGQPEGDIIEGRIAGSLWDLYDSINETITTPPCNDRSTVDLATIWGIQRATSGFTFSSFWAYSSGVLNINKHTALQTLYLNSIDYDNPPTAYPMSNIIVLQGGVLDNAVDLWAGAFNDMESIPSEMNYSIVNTLPNCGARIDSNQYIDIDLRSNPTYLGNCSVTVRASDGIKSVDNTFQENIQRVVVRNHLPYITSIPGGGGGAAAAAQPSSPSGAESSPSSAYPAPKATTNTDAGTPSKPGASSNPYPAPKP